jgi:hypothetical protein
VKTEFQQDNAAITTSADAIPQQKFGSVSGATVEPRLKLSFGREKSTVYGHFLVDVATGTFVWMRRRRR